MFEDPETFDPDRFARAREKALPKSAYLPFGTGGNVCPGSHLAMMEGHLLTAVMAQRLRVDLLPGQEIRPQLLVNLRPSPGYGRGWSSGTDVLARAPASPTRVPGREVVGQSA